MLRLNGLVSSRHLNQLSNVWTKSSYYYSSEPPDKWCSLGAIRTPDTRPHAVITDHSDSFLRTTNPELNLFGPHDTRFPLNGNIGINWSTRNTHWRSTWMTQLNTFNTNPVVNTTDIDIHLFLSNSYKSRCHKFFRILKHETLATQHMASAVQSSDNVDCNAYDLSVQVMKKFELLFPKDKRQELSEGLTAVMLSRKTVNDMSGYSEAVEEERTDFFDKFVVNANIVCQELQKSGYWADFIDPYSGQPFLSQHTNETLFETDDRFIHLGFKIEDLGCCKAIYHHKWGTHVIVGTIFTTAPTNSPALTKLMTQSVDWIK